MEFNSDLLIGIIGAAAAIIGTTIAVKSYRGKPGKLVVSAFLSDQDGASGILACGDIEYVYITATNHGEAPVLLESVNAEIGPSIKNLISHPLSTGFIELGLIGPETELPIKLEHGESYNFKLPIKIIIENNSLVISKISVTDSLKREFKLSDPPLSILKRQIKKLHKNAKDLGS